MTDLSAREPGDATTSPTDVAEAGPSSGSGVDAVSDAASDGMDDPDLGAVLRRVDGVLSEPPDEVTRRRHLGAIAAAVDAAGTEAVPGDLGGVGASSGATPWDHVRHRIGVALVAAVAAAAVGLATAGLLPAPVQRVAAETAARVGWELPTPASSRARDAVPDLELLPLPDRDGIGERTNPGGDIAPSSPDRPRIERPSPAAPSPPPPAPPASAPPTRPEYLPPAVSTPPPAPRPAPGPPEPVVTPPIPEVAPDGARNDRPEGPPAESPGDGSSGPPEEIPPDPGAGEAPPDEVHLQGDTDVFERPRPGEDATSVEPQNVPPPTDAPRR